MKTYKPKKQCCIDCNVLVSQQVYIFSTSKMGMPLCIPCQENFTARSFRSTKEATELYIALRIRGVPAELEKWDGHKTIDIAVPEAKVNIEVDGSQHAFSTRQALSDLKRTYYAFKKGYLTLRIPNTLVRHNIDETADYITEFLTTSVMQLDRN